MAEQLPQALIESLQTVKGFDETSFREVHHSGELLVSVRINPAKVKDPAQLPLLKELFAGEVPWAEHGYYLKERPVFTTDPLFHAGAYYVQEASSMFLELTMRQCCALDSPLQVLDLCAAPGGKSTLLQSLISSNSLLVSNEVIKQRAGILAENITKWGAPNVVVTNNDPKDFQKLPSFFDCIVIDAPCSGSGMFRKDPEAISEWSLNNVELCSQRQQRILADVWDALKPGGILIYSTCSYSQEEDEDIADWLKENYDVSPLPLKVQEEWGIVESISPKQQCYGYRFYPGKVKGEGFFIAAFRKESDEGSTSRDKKNLSKNILPSKTEESIARSFLDISFPSRFIKWQHDILTIPASIFDAVLQLQQQLYIRKAGVNMGTIIRDELVPSHEWIMSTVALADFPSVATDESMALDYLRRKDIHPETTVRGWAVITYAGIALGLVKILPNRVNNYYPKDWRILNK